MSKKSLYILIILLLFTFSICAQEKFGVLAGGNYPLQSRNGELVSSGMILNPEAKVGYHGGVFYQKFFNNFFLMPQLIFSHGNVDYFIDDVSPEYTLDKLNGVFNFGYQFFNKIDAFAGLGYQYFLKNELESAEFPLREEISRFNFLLGLKIPVSRRFDVSFSYDCTFNSNDTQAVTLTFPDMTEQFRIDEGRINLLMLSLHYSIFDTTKAKSSKGNRGCYF